MQHSSGFQLVISRLARKLSSFIVRIRSLPMPILVASGLFLAGVVSAGTIVIIKNVHDNSGCSTSECIKQADESNGVTGSDSRKSENETPKSSIKPDEKTDKKPTSSQTQGSTPPQGGTSSGGVTTPLPSGGDTTPPPSSGSQSCPAYPAFPDENCTGVPAGISLTTVADLSTTSNGQVIDAMLVLGELVINHDNVTVKNSRVKGRVVYNDHRGLVLQDADLGPDSCPTSSNGGYRLLAGGDYTLIRTHLHHNAADLLALGGGGTITIQDSLFNNTCYYAGDHLDAIQLYDPGAVTNVTVAHSRIDARTVNVVGFGNAAIFWADSPGAGSRLTMYQNLFAGGNYTTYLLDAPSGSNIIIDVHDNRFVRDTYNYGPCTAGGTDPFDGSAGLKWVNNAFSDGVTIAITDC